MRRNHLFIGFFTILVFLVPTSFAGKSQLWRNAKPCERIVLHLHDIFQLDNNKTMANATSASQMDSNIPGFGPYFFGRMFVFDNPMTLDEKINSPPAARAQGFYLYDQKDAANTLFLTTLSFNSSEHTGTLTIIGNNSHDQKMREFSVIGGTGDFFMARGITTVELEAFDFGASYFRLKMDIKLYECY